MGPQPLACPSCGSEDLASVERLTGTCPGRFVCQVDGRVRFIDAGVTDVDWDSSTPDGVECGACGWRDRGDDWADRLAAAGSVGQATAAPRPFRVSGTNPPTSRRST
jgi:hypothetical protein